MDELLDLLVAKVGIDRGVAEKAVGIILAFLLKEGPSDKVQALINQMPGAEPVSEATQELIDSEVRRIVDEEHETTTRVVSINRERLDNLAEALLERETLDEVDAYAVAGIDRRGAPVPA